VRLQHRRREEQNSNHPENPEGQGSHDKDRHDAPPLWVIVLRFDQRFRDYHHRK
jgi:hypothetical protein